MFIKLGMFVSLVMWKCNLTRNFKMPALFLGPGSSLGQGKAELFSVEPLQGWVSAAMQACPSGGRGSWSGGTPELILLSVKQRHSKRYRWNSVNQCVWK